jgi:hypothetical protein
VPCLARYSNPFSKAKFVTHLTVLPNEEDIQNQITITLFPDQSAKKCEEMRGSWDQLLKAVLETRKPTKAALPWLKMALFGDIKTIKGSLRHDANVLAITGIEADYDGEAISVDEAIALLEGRGVKAMVYTSPSHTPEKPRWRVLCPVSVELPPERRERLVARLNGVLGGILAGESFTRSQAFYFGRVGENPDHRAIIVEGTPIDLLDGLDAGAKGRPETKAATKSPKTKGAPRGAEAKVAEGGPTPPELPDSYHDRIVSGVALHDTTVRWAGTMANQGVSAEEAIARIQEAFDATPADQRDERWEERRGDIGRCVEDIYAKRGAEKAALRTMFGNRRELFDCEDHDVKMRTVREEIMKANEGAPTLFRGVDGRIVQLERSGAGRLLIQPVGKSELSLEIDKAVRCMDVRKTTKQVSVWDPVATQTLIDRRLVLPVLQGVVSAPVFGADGTIRTEAGYSSASGVFYDPRGLTVPDVPSCPSQGDVDKAKGLLDEALCDFPFDGSNGAESERAHMLGLLLLPFARQMIAGPTPIHLIVKPTPGTGASKLVNAWSLIAHGCEAATQTETRQEDEWRKRITSVLVEGSNAFYLDNLNHKVDSSALASAVTAPVWTDRVLGTNKIASVPVHLTWIFCGNNPTMSNEIARRCVRIRLDAKVERPELRTGFRHPDLEGWVRGCRGELVWACLTLLQNWIVQGRVAPDRVMGSFESWSHVIGGTLKAAGIIGFLANDAEMRADADEEGRATRAFLSAWWEKYGDRYVLAGKDLYDDLCCGNEDIALPLNSTTHEGRKGALGRFVGHLKGRIFTVQGNDGANVSVKVVPGPSRGGATKWKMEPLKAG